MSTILGLALLWFGGALLAAAYWAPTIVAARRSMPNIGGIAIINGLTGWTCIGWVISMAMACNQRVEAPSAELVR